MTSHELAQKLMNGPNLPVVIDDHGELNEIKAIEPTPDFKAIRLFRIENP